MLGFGTNHIIDPGQLELQHLPVHEQDGLERLVLCGGRDFAVNRKMGQKLFDVLLPQFLRMPWVMKADESAKPVEIDSLRCDAKLS